MLLLEPGHQFARWKFALPRQMQTQKDARVIFVPPDWPFGFGQFDAKYLDPKGPRCMDRWDRLDG